jgi:hypothetical protein
MSKSKTGENHPMFDKHHSEEAKRKISEGNAGKIRSEEFKKNISKVRKGKKHSKESIQKMREAKMGKKYSKETIQKMREAKTGENHPMFGRKHSEESKQKMREAMNRPEMKQRMSNIHKGKELSEEHKRKIKEILSRPESKQKIRERIENMPYIYCPYCNKAYKFSKSLEKHVEICDNKNKEVEKKNGRRRDGRDS